MTAVDDLPDVWVEALEGYVQWMNAANRSRGTVRLHRHYVSHVARCAPSPAGVTASDLEGLLGNPTWKDETRKSARSVMIVFFRWCRQAGYVKSSPARRLPKVTVGAGVPKPAPQDVFDDAFRRGSEDQRTMLLLARYAGLRCCEIAAVRGVDLDGDMLHVVGKGRKHRVVPIVHAGLVATIRATPGYLFPGGDGGHVGADWVSRQLGRLLPGEWTAHKLRHAYASRAYANGADIYAIAQALGHSRLETTQRYTQMPMDNLRRVSQAAEFA